MAFDIICFIDLEIRQWIRVLRYCIS